MGVSTDSKADCIQTILGVYTQAELLAFLCLGFFIWQIRLTTDPMLWGYCEEQISGYGYSPQQVPGTK